MGIYVYSKNEKAGILPCYNLTQRTDHPNRHLPYNQSMLGEFSMSIQ